MLPLSGRPLRIEPVIEFDPYIPLSITWPGQSRAPLLYWRVGDHHRSLAEVGFDASTGQIRSFTLTLLEGFEEVDVLPPLPLHDAVDGLLHADPGRWEGARFLDERIAFRVSLSPSGIRFVLQPECTPCERFVSGSVQMVLDGDGRLVELRVEGLGREQWAVLRGA